MSVQPLWSTMSIEASESLLSQASSDADTRPLASSVLSDLFSLFVDRAQSTVFRLTTPTETVFLRFTDGHLLDAVSSSSPHGQRLGEILVAQGVLTGPQLETFLTEQKSGTSRIGERLVASGLIRPADLSRARQDQVKSMLKRLTEAPNVHLTITT
jgi:hypothetical protein